MGVYRWGWDENAWGKCDLGKVGRHRPHAKKVRWLLLLVARCLRQDRTGRDRKGREALESSIAIAFAIPHVVGGCRWYLLEKHGWLREDICRQHTQSMVLPVRCIVQWCVRVCVLHGNMRGAVAGRGKRSWEGDDSDETKTVTRRRQKRDEEMRRRGDDDDDDDDDDEKTG